MTVHIPLPTSNSKSTLHKSLLALHALVTNSPDLASRADIHLVLSPFPRAFNTWRNLARLLARTTYILLLDVDFAICTDWRASVSALLRDGENDVGQRVRGGIAALVLPAFEYVKQAEGRNQAVFPQDKRALLGLVHANRIAPFHASFSAGHNSTDYRRFYTAKPGEIYKVTQYQAGYEPYVVVRKDAGGWCDERFTGYGGNKAACLFEMYLSGVSFYVLSDHFLIHQSHTYEEEARKNEVSATVFSPDRELCKSSAKIAQVQSQDTLRLQGGNLPQVSQAFFRSRCSQHDTCEQCPGGVQENQGDREDCHAAARWLSKYVGRM